MKDSFDRQDSEEAIDALLEYEIIDFISELVNNPDGDGDESKEETENTIEEDETFNKILEDIKKIREDEGRDKKKTVIFNLSVIIDKEGETFYRMKIWNEVTGITGDEFNSNSDDDDSYIDFEKMGILPPKGYKRKRKFVEETIHLKRSEIVQMKSVSLKNHEILNSDFPEDYNDLTLITTQGSKDFIIPVPCDVFAQAFYKL